MPTPPPHHHSHTQECPSVHIHLPSPSLTCVHAQPSTHAFFPTWFKQSVRCFLLSHQRLQRQLTYPAAREQQAQCFGAQAVLPVMTAATASAATTTATHLGHLPTLLVREFVCVCVCVRMCLCVLGDVGCRVWGAGVSPLSEAAACQQRALHVYE
jgi:hypothetical protein